MSISSPLTIRPAEAGDAARIVELIRQMGQDSPLTADYVLHYLSGAGRNILLARRGEEVLGLLSYSVRADLYHAGNSVLIEELVVEERHRGEGIGGALLNAVLEKVPDLECRELCLAVMPDNADAIRLYRRYGLTEEALFLERHFEEHL
jgi:ribosomal protein S18 acetylase RimI-like enzyme